MILLKPFLKRTGLFYLYNLLAIFAGTLIAGIPTLLLRSTFQPDALGSNLITGIIDTLCVMGLLFFLMQRDVYERRVFSLKTVVFPVIIVCSIRWLLWYVSGGKAAFWATGSSVFFSPILFPNISFEFHTEEAVFYQLICTIIFDLLITVPVFIGGGYFGYWRRKHENKKMIETHEQAH